MIVRELFAKDIFRPINGVVKADDVDDNTVWQELDEFVVTRELRSHLSKFFSAYAEGIENPKNVDISGKIGVWIAGFFGSGKSHFLKILGYLLRNAVHKNGNQSKRAVEFFNSKINDPLVFANVKKAVESHTDVILFNIDSKADINKGKEAILHVFLKTLNDLQGYCPEHPHIAHMERHLDSKSKLKEFEGEYKRLTGHEWRSERDAYEFNRDEVVAALQKTLAQSKETCERWADGAEEKFSLSVESFAKCVKEYLDKQGDKRRLIFLIDEVGGFIGKDGGLMLNLQTIVENLGTYCKGKAWVVITAQEDLDKVLGDMPRSAANDFSKIQGRFVNRLSLSSANVDEVIQERLLLKVNDPQTTKWLSDTYKQKGDILKNQLSFTNCGMTLKQFQHSDEFASNYPFAPYQFQLLQKIFEAIRTRGATGLHLAQGERSLLDAFQSAAQAVADMDVGVLVPLYRFYPSIESFLDTAVKRTIDQAKDNLSLKPFDNEILRALFLIRYVDEIKGNIDNLTTLCIDTIDADRIALRRKIEDSLSRLERETLINRSGDNYFFLTNEERDINREIKQVDLSSNEEAKLIGEILFDDILKGSRKYRYSVTKRDFEFNRMCDCHPYGSRNDKALTVQVFTPMAEIESDAVEDGGLLRISGQDGGQVVVRLEDEPTLSREIRQYLQTDKYLKTRADDSTPELTKRIHRNLADDNRERRKRLEIVLETLLSEAKYFVCQQRLTTKSSTPQTAIDASLEYLITNTFPKMGYITKYIDEPKRELQAVLRANDMQSASLSGTNEKAMEELRDFIELASKANRPIVLFELIEKYAVRPYGWSDDETLILVARLLVLGEIHLHMNASVLPVDKAYENLISSLKQRKITVVRRSKVDPQKLQDARNLGRTLFSQMGPDSEDGLHDFLRSHFQAMRTSLVTYKALADTRNYPGADEITNALSIVGAVLAQTESGVFLERFLENKTALEDLHDEFHDINHFYTHQRTAWDKLKKAADRFQLNKDELDTTPEACGAFARIKEIILAVCPYKLVHEAEGLIEKVELVNSRVIAKAREDAGNKIRLVYEQLSTELQKINADGGLQKACVAPLDTIREAINRHTSVAHILQACGHAGPAMEAALLKIEEYLRAKKPDEQKLVSKPRKEIRPADFVKTACIETEEDIKAFLDALRVELQASLHRGERIRIC